MNKYLLKLKVNDEIIFSKFFTQNDKNVIGKLFLIKKCDNIIYYRLFAEGISYNLSYFDLFKSSYIKIVKIIKK